MFLWRQKDHTTEAVHLLVARLQALEWSCLHAQIDSKPRHDVNVTEEDLLKIPQGPRTEACLRHNCVVGVQYLEAWLGGLGCVPLYNLMEDAATAEICRTQARPRPVL